MCVCVCVCVCVCIYTYIYIYMYVYYMLVSVTLGFLIYALVSVKGFKKRPVNIIDFCSKGVFV